MKYKLYLLLGCVFGLMCFMEGSDTQATIKMSYIVGLPAYAQINCKYDFLPDITHWFIPMLAFQMIYGVYIYRHFCSASIYFFSRNANRKKWFSKEAAKLYVYAVAYVSIMLVTGIAVKLIRYNVEWDEPTYIIIVYYILINSMYLFCATLAINVLSVRFSSSVGFIAVMAINLLSITSFASYGELLDESILYRNYQWLFEVNPFAHLVLWTHSSVIDSVNEVINVKGFDCDLNVSVVLFAVLGVIAYVCGCYVCDKHEFILSNMEEV